MLEEGVWDSHRAVFVRTVEYIPITVQISVMLFEVQICKDLDVRGELT